MSYLIDTEPMFLPLVVNTWPSTAAFKQAQ